MAPYGKSSISIFQQFFASIDNFNFGSKIEHHATILSRFEIFLIFPNFLSLELFGNSYIPCLLLIVRIGFSCSDTKTLSNIKMSQSIMTRIVWKIFFCFLCLNKQLQLLKTVILLAEIYFIFVESVKHQTSKTFNTKFGPQWKDRKSRSQVKQMFALFGTLVALILG